MKKGRKERRDRKEGGKGGIGNGNEIWKYKMVRPLWKMVYFWFLHKSNLKLLYDLAIPLPKKLKIAVHTKTCP